eukprot:m.143144 g.143144  ORF g.143144 m.143144 type:complete len:1528 (+) comp17159_c0_seq2:219-4802(+)
MATPGFVGDSQPASVPSSDEHSSANPISTTDAVPSTQPQTTTIKNKSKGQNKKPKKRKPKGRSRGGRKHHKPDQAAAGKASARALVGRRELFDKHFCFSAPTDTLPPLASCFRANSKGTLKELRETKDAALAVRGLLSDKDIAVWHRLTRFTNQAGNVVQAVRQHAEAEMGTTAFMKLYEILYRFDLLPTPEHIEGNGPSPTINTVHACEAPGAFVAATNHALRQLWGSRLVWDWTGLTLNPYYENIDPSAIIDDDLFILCTESNWCFGRDNTGDMMSVENIEALRAAAQAKGKVCLYTADGSIDCSSMPERQESMVANLHFCEVVGGLCVLAEGGHLVVKMFTFYEDHSVNLLYLLHHCFEELWVTKPATSKAGNSETYVVGKRFKGLPDCELEALLAFVGPAFPTSSASEGEGAPDDMDSDTTTPATQQPGCSGAPTTMFDVDALPTAFKDDAIACAKFFESLSTAAVRRNIDLDENGKGYLEDRAIKTARVEVAWEWVQRFEIEPILPHHRVVLDTCLDGYQLNTGLRVAMTHSDHVRRSCGTLADRRESTTKHQLFVQRARCGQAHTQPLQRTGLDRSTGRKRHREPDDDTLSTVAEAAVLPTSPQAEPGSRRARSDNDNNDDDNDVGGGNRGSVGECDNSAWCASDDGWGRQSSCHNNAAAADVQQTDLEPAPSTDSSVVRDGDLVPSTVASAAAVAPTATVSSLPPSYLDKSAATAPPPAQYSGFARKQLQSMGLEPGQGLGRQGQGRVAPVQVSLRTKGVGLGYSSGGNQPSQACNGIPGAPWFFECDGLAPASCLGASRPRGSSKTPALQSGGGTVAADGGVGGRPKARLPPTTAATGVGDGEDDGAGDGDGWDAGGTAHGRPAAPAFVPAGAAESSAAGEFPVANKTGVAASAGTAIKAPRAAADDTVTSAGGAWSCPRPAGIGNAAIGGTRPRAAAPAATAPCAAPSHGGASPLPNEWPRVVGRRLTAVLMSKFCRRTALTELQECRQHVADHEQQNGAYANRAAVCTHCALVAHACCQQDRASREQVAHGNTDAAATGATDIATRATDAGTGAPDAAATGAPDSARRATNAAPAATQMASVPTASMHPRSTPAPTPMITRGHTPMPTAATQHKWTFPSSLLLGQLDAMFGVASSMSVLDVTGDGGTAEYVAQRHGSAATVVSVRPNGPWAADAWALLHSSTKLCDGPVDTLVAANAVAQHVAATAAASMDAATATPATATTVAAATTVSAAAPTQTPAPTPTPTKPAITPNATPIAATTPGSHRFGLVVVGGPAVWPVASANGEDVVAGAASARCKRLLLGSLIVALWAMRPGGTLVLRLGDAFTRFHAGVVCALSQSFGRSELLKPFACCSLTADRVLVCTEANRPAVDAVLTHLSTCLNEYDTIGISTNAWDSSRAAGAAGAVAAGAVKSAKGGSAGHTAEDDLLSFVPMGVLLEPTFFQFLTHANERHVAREIAALRALADSAHNHQRQVRGGPSSPSKDDAVALTRAAADLATSALRSCPWPECEPGSVKEA